MKLTMHRWWACAGALLAFSGLWSVPGSASARALSFSEAVQDLHHDFEQLSGQDPVTDSVPLGIHDGLVMQFSAVTAVPVPEPGGAALMLAGGLVLWQAAAMRRARQPGRSLAGRHGD
jgi:hypothetical protein